MAGEELAFYLAHGGRIIELDMVRAGHAAPAELAAVPQWMLDDPTAWAVVPLIHLNQVIGAILLGRPPIDRALDWEDFDLLRIAGRQVASYLAEARAHMRDAEPATAGRAHDEAIARQARVQLESELPARGVTIGEVQVNVAAAAGAALEITMQLAWPRV